MGVQTSHFPRFPPIVAATTSCFSFLFFFSLRKCAQLAFNVALVIVIFNLRFKEAYYFQTVFFFNVEGVSVSCLMNVFGHCTFTIKVQLFVLLNKILLILNDIPTLTCFNGFTIVHIHIAKHQK